MGGLTTIGARAAQAGDRGPARNQPNDEAMRILRPQPTGLRCRVRLADGRWFTGELPPARHRAIQLGMLHADTPGLVELTPGTRQPDGSLAIDRRTWPEHFLPGGASGHPAWLSALLLHADRIIDGAYAQHDGKCGSREEAFVGVAARSRSRGGKDAIAETRFLWLDVDRPGQLPKLWELLAERPCHLLIESGGSGGVHAYWKLDRPLPATRTDPVSGEVTEPIERAHLRIIHRLGVDEHGKPNVADPMCAERARVMRLAGTVNWKTGQYARIVEADLHLPAYTLDELVGDLQDPPNAPRARRPLEGDGRHDPYKRIAPPDYFRRLAGISVPRRGLVRCPVPAHDDRHPSCSVGATADSGWCCFASTCGARGAIYDLASVLLGGPWGRELRGDAFRRARAHVQTVFQEVSPRAPARIATQGGSRR